MFSSSSSAHRYLKGTWACGWATIPATGASGAAIAYEVKTESVRGVRVKGKGNNPSFGDYFLNGEASDFVVTLHYDEGARKSAGLAGVVILKKVTLTHLSGVWCQYSSKGDLESGTTEWKKK